MPRYDELQERTIEAIPFPPRRVLELGVGTGETARRLLARYPDAELTGLDSEPEMVFKARELGIEVRLARMEDPLPDGPWDLVISVLSVHHLDRRAEAGPVPPRARAVPGDGHGRRGDRRRQVAPLEEGVDLPSRARTWPSGAEARSSGEADDLAVIRAVYEQKSPR